MFVHRPLYKHLLAMAGFLVLIVPDIVISFVILISLNIHADYITQSTVD